MATFFKFHAAASTSGQTQLGYSWAKPTQACRQTVQSRPVCLYVRLGVTGRRSPLMFYILSSWAKPTQGDCPVTPSLSVRASGRDWEAEPIIVLHSFLLGEAHSGKLSTHAQSVCTCVWA